MVDNETTEVKKKGTWGGARQILAARVLALAESL